MLKSSSYVATASAVLLALTTACSSTEQSQDTPAVSPSSKLETKAASRIATTDASPNLSSAQKTEGFQVALDSGMSAATIAQSAESKDDWNLVISRWKTAINLLKMVPKSNSNYAKAQKKIPEYQRNLAYAQQQLKNPSKPQNVAFAPQEVAAKSNPVTPSTPADAYPKQISASVVASKVALASYLKQTGARFYGTYWCGYCNKQKEMFGQQAVKQLNYIECDPRGKNPQFSLCQKAKISSFPTWEINGQQRSGMLSLEELSDLSGYQGNRNFGS